MNAQNIRTRRYSYSFVFTAISLLVVRSAIAASFQAELHSVTPETTRVYEIFVKDLKYRLEFTDDGHDMFVVVDPVEGISRVARRDEKLYFEMPTDHVRSILNDPFQSLAFMKLMGEITPEGTEEVNGFECKKTLVTYKEQRVATCWTSLELNFPLKIVMYPPNDKVVEIVNIRERELDDSLFRIPEDYEPFEY